jgi:hypothetical protein
MNANPVQSAEIVEAELVQESNAWPVSAIPASGKALITRSSAPFERTGDDPYGVPRRFGVGTLLIVTAAYGALLALLRALDWNRAAIAWFILFISLIGTGQMFLFGSRRPREASLLAGAISLPVIVILTFMFHSSGREPPTALACAIMSALLFGAPAGYLAGGVVAGVFLIMDAVQQQLARFSRSNDEASRDKPSDEMRDEG